MTATHAPRSTGPRPEPRTIDVSDLPYDAITAYVEGFDGSAYLERRPGRTLLVVE